MSFAQCEIAEIVARRDILRKCADKVRGLRRKRIRPAAAPKDKGRGGKNHNNNDTCYCCGQPELRRLDCRYRNKVCSRCGHLNEICQSGQNVTARAVEREPDVHDETPYKEIQIVWALSAVRLVLIHAILGVSFCA